MHNPKGHSALQQLTVGTVHPREAVCFQGRGGTEWTDDPLLWVVQALLCQGPHLLEQMVQFLLGTPLQVSPMFSGLCQWGRTRAGYTHAYRSEPDSCCLAEPLLATRAGWWSTRKQDKCTPVGGALHNYISTFHIAILSRRL